MPVATILGIREFATFSERGHASINSTAENYWRGLLTKLKFANIFCKKGKTSIVIIEHFSLFYMMCVIISLFRKFKMRKQWQFFFIISITRFVMGKNKKKEEQDNLTMQDKDLDSSHNPTEERHDKLTCS